MDGQPPSAFQTLTQFFVRLQLRKGSGEKILPVLCEDNYISILPGESREIRATYAVKDRGDRPVALAISGWNVK